jgi:intracellular sulfur oxidation DsrE/DsrF family protein
MRQVFYRVFAISAFALLFSAVCIAQKWPSPISPAIPAAEGYVIIPGAAVTPDPRSVYRVLMEGMRAPSKPDELVPAVNAVGNVLNTLVAGHVPLRNIHLAVVFRGPAVDYLLSNDLFRAKFGVDNPNIKVLTELKQKGVELLICGQHLAAAGIDPSVLSKDVVVASDAYIVTITYQNRGYAMMWF